MYLLLKLILLVFVNCVESEVVDLNFASCKQFFYKGSPPSGFENQNYTAICQRYDNSYHFATLYNSEARIPVFSAYTLDTLKCPRNQPKRRSKWFIEPQLSGTSNVTDMSKEGASGTHKMKQAINVDYFNTNYDKGHLNPNFYQCYQSRTATFTLTNAVPQDPCFNQQMWKKMEKKSKDIMQDYCDFEGAKRFFITGATPSWGSIPNEFDDSESDRVRDYNRVKVPSVMWTAACCDSTNAKKPEDRSKGFSFGYYGDNSPDSSINSCSVSVLKNELTDMYGIPSLDIFSDDCSPSPNSSVNAMNKLKVPIIRQITHVMSTMIGYKESLVRPATRKMIALLQERLYQGMTLQNMRFINGNVAILSKRSHIPGTSYFMASFGLLPILINPDFTSSIDKLQNTTILDRELRDLHNQINTIRGPNDITDEYIVLSSHEHTLSATLSLCRHDHPCDYYGYNYKWCYIDWYNNWDYCCNKACGIEQVTKYSWCLTGEGTHWAYCSMRSSMVSVPGRQCRADHECGTHGEKYHWCYTDTKQNWEYCCQPWHVCAEHGNSYKWCYVGRNTYTNWQYCYY